MGHTFCIMSFCLMGWKPICMLICLKTFFCKSQSHSRCWYLMQHGSDDEMMKPQSSIKHQSNSQCCFTCNLLSLLLPVLFPKIGMGGRLFQSLKETLGICLLITGLSLWQVFHQNKWTRNSLAHWNKSYEFLISVKYFNPNQHSFHKGLLCESQLPTFVGELWPNLDANILTNVSFLGHPCPALELSKLSLDLPILTWIGNFLLDR